MHLVAGARVPCARCSIPSGEHGTRDEDAAPLLEVAASLDPSHRGRALSSLAYLLISGSAEAQKRGLRILSNGGCRGASQEHPKEIGTTLALDFRKC